MSYVTASSRHLTASAVVFHPYHRDRFLLVWHNATGLWVVPGGHVDPDEAPHEAAAREVMEETGIQVQILGQRLDLPGMYPHPHPITVQEIPAPAKPHKGEPAHHHIDMLYVAAAARPDLAGGDEGVGAAVWAALGELDMSKVRAEVPDVVRLAAAYL